MILYICANIFTIFVCKNNYHDKYRIKKSADS
jgi:hypothetical protein